MSTDRNTHFAGFAEAVYQKLKDAEIMADSVNPYIETNQAMLIIAQHVYDLVEHIMDTAYAHDMCTTMDEIPDMPTLPVEETERKRLLREITHLAEDAGIYD